MNYLNQSKITQSWCQNRHAGQANFTPTTTQKHVVVAILEPICQYQPSLTIHYTYNETLEGSSCYEIVGSIQKHTILMLSRGAFHQNCLPPQLKSLGVVMVMHDKF